MVKVPDLGQVSAFGGRLSGGSGPIEYSVKHFSVRLPERPRLFPAVLPETYSSIFAQEYPRLGQHAQVPESPDSKSRSALSDRWFQVNEIEIVTAKKKMTKGVRYFNFLPKGKVEQGDDFSALKKVVLLDESMNQADHYLSAEV